jgi:hypothetical protein
MDTVNAKKRWTTIYWRVNFDHKIHLFFSLFLSGFVHNFRAHLGIVKPGGQLTTESDLMPTFELVIRWQLHFPCDYAVSRVFMIEACQ